MGLFSKKKKPEAAPVAAEAAVPAAGIPGEVVAAIAAAVACVLGEGARIVGIRREAKRSGRSAWSMAGLLDNTRPF